jgi:hypothetical protein
MAAISSWALAVTLASAIPVAALAPTSDVARVCRQRAIEAHPTQPAGSKHGSAEAQRAYFRDCLSKMDAGPLRLSEAQKSNVLRILGPQGASTLGLSAVSVGGEVPRGAQIKNFPSEVTRLVPELAPYRYFAVENVIAVVRPSSAQVVALIEGR